MDKLKNDEAFKDFLKAIQFDKLRDIVRAYAQNDAQCREALAFVKTDTHQKNTDDLDKLPEYRAMMDHFEKHGVALYQYIIILRTYLFELDVDKLEAAKHKPTGSGFSGLMADLRAVLPKEEIAKIAKDKSTSSERFKKIMGALKSDEYKTLRENLRKTPVFQKYTGDLKTKGVDVPAVAAFARAVIGLE